MLEKYRFQNLRALIYTSSPARRQSSAKAHSKYGLRHTTQLSAASFHLDSISGTSLSCNPAPQFLFWTRPTSSRSSSHSVTSPKASLLHFLLLTAKHSLGANKSRKSDANSSLNSVARSQVSLDHSKSEFHPPSSNISRQPATGNNSNNFSPSSFCRHKVQTILTSSPDTIVCENPFGQATPETYVKAALMFVSNFCLFSFIPRCIPLSPHLQTRDLEELQTVFMQKPFKSHAELNDADIEKENDVLQHHPQSESLSDEIYRTPPSQSTSMKQPHTTEHSFMKTV